YDHAGVLRIAYADATTVVDTHPRGTRRGVDQSVQQGPIGDRVRPIAHAFRLAERTGDAAGIKVIAADHDRRLQLAGTDKLVHRQPELGALAVAEPADAGRKSLELDPLPCERNPSGQRFIVREEFEREPVRAVDIGRVTGERDPA